MDGGVEDLEVGVPARSVGKCRSSPNDVVRVSYFRRGMRLEDERRRGRAGGSSTISSERVESASCRQF